MNNILTLYKLYFRKTYARSAGNKKSRATQIGYGVLAVLGVGIIAFLCWISYTMTKTFQESGGMEYLLSSLMFAVQMILLIYGTITLISVVFRSRDNELLRGFPMRPIEIFAAKMLYVTTNNLIIPAAVLIPTFITIGISGGYGASFYLLMIVCVLFTPLIPMLLATIIALPIMYLARYFKKSPIVSLLLMILAYAGAMAIYLGVIYAINSSLITTAFNSQNIYEVLLVPLKTISMVIYPNLYIARAMIGVGAVSNTFIYLGIILAALVVVILLSALMFNRVVSASLESSGTVRSRNKERQKQSSKIACLITNDMRNLYKQTSLMFSSLIGLFIAPIFGIFSMISMGSMGDGGGGSGGIMIVFTFLVSGAMNYFATIGVSRDNNQFFINKFLPITPKEYLSSKIIIANAYVLAVSLVILVTNLVVKETWYNTLFMFVVGIVFGCGMNAFSLYRDLANPKLNWANIKEITNNRMTVIVPTLISIAVGIAAMVAIMLLGNELWKVLLIWGVIALVSLAGLIASYWILLSKRDMLYNRIEATNG